MYYKLNVLSQFTFNLYQFGTTFNIVSSYLTVLRLTPCHWRLTYWHRAMNDFMSTSESGSLHFWQSLTRSLTQQSSSSEDIDGAFSSTNWLIPAISTWNLFVLAAHSIICSIALTHSLHSSGVLASKSKSRCHLSFLRASSRCKDLVVRAEPKMVKQQFSCARYFPNLFRFRFGVTRPYHVCSHEILWVDIPVAIQMLKLKHTTGVWPKLAMPMWEHRKS